MWLLTSISTAMNYLKLLAIHAALFPLSLFASPYHFNFNQELGFIGFGTGLEIAGLYANSKKTKPTTQSVASLNKNDINSIDRFVAGRWNQSAGTRSDIVLYSTLVAPLLLPIVHRSSFWDISLLYAETVLITNGGMNVAKGFSNRYRPYAYNSDVPNDTLYDLDTKRSFFSGHAAHITASSVFFAKVYSDMNPNSPYKNTVWLGSGLVTLFGSWQRLESGMHYPTDIIAGIAWGGLVGYSIPEWHLKRHKINVLPLIDTDNVGIQFFSSIN